MSDISASATLNATAFSQGLQAALAESRRWRTEVSKVLNFDPVQKMTAATRKLRTELTALKPPKLDVDAKSTTAAIVQAAEAARAGVVENKKLDSSLADLRARAEAAQQAFFDGGSTFDEYRQKQAALGTELTQLIVEQQDSARSVKALTGEMRDLDEVTKELGKAVRLVRSDYITGRIGADEYRNSSETLKRVMDDLRNTTALTQDQQLRLSIASATAERGLAMLRGEASRLGLAQGVAIGTTMSLREQQALLATQTAQLTGGYRQLAGVLTAVFATAGIGRYIRTLTEFSAEAAAARNAASLFYDQLARDGRSAEAADGVVERLSTQFESTADSVQSNVTIMLRAGANLTQIEDILRGAGASAIAFARSAEEGFTNAAEAFVSGRSTLLNSIGISKDLSVAYREMARELDTTVENLTDVQRAAAFQNLVLSETRSEVESVTTVMRSFIGAQQRGRTELALFRRAAGDGAAGFLTPLLNVGTGLLRVFNALPAPLQRVVTGTVLLTGAVAALGIAYGTIRAVLARTQVIQTGVTALVTREAIGRTVLGGTLLNLAARYKLLTAEQLTNTAATRANAASVGLLGGALQATRAGFTTAITGVRNLTTASLRFAATPVGAVLVAIAAAVALVTTAVRRNDAIVRPAFDAFARAVQAAEASLEPLRLAMTSLFREGGLLATLWRNTLIVVAKALALTMLAVAESVERAALGFKFLEEVATVGPIQAFRNATAANEELTASYARLREEIDAAAGAAFSGVTTPAGVEEAGDAAELSAEQLAKFREEAEETARTLRERFRDISGSLMPDGQEKDIRAVREEYRRLRDEIRSMADENPEFQAEGFLAQSYELEQQAIVQLQAKYAEERRKQAEQQGRELADTIRERERAIVDVQTRGRQTEVQSLTLEFRRRTKDTERLYADLIAKAREYGQDTTDLERLRTNELLAVQNAYRRDVLNVYDQLRTEIDNRQRGLLREALTARGDTVGLAGLDFDDAIRDLETFYDDAREQAAGNASLLAAIEAQEGATRLAAWERYWREVTNLANERSQALLEREEAIARGRADLNEDAAAGVRIAATAELREINRAYDALETAAQGNATELERIASLRNQELALANDRLASNLTELAETARAEAFAPVVDTLLDGLETASASTLTSIRQQLQSWQIAYGSNGEIAKLVTTALDQVGNAYARVRETAAREVDRLTEDASRLLDALRIDDAARGMSTVETTLFTAAQRVRELREQQEALLAASADATEDEKARLTEAAAQLDQGIRLIEANATADARSVAQEAVRAYADGLEQARADVGKVAFDAISGDLRSFMEGVTRVNADALRSARAQLYQLFNDLTARGVPRDELDGIQTYIDQVNGLLDQHATNLADFASQQFDVVRRVGTAILDEADARRLNIALATEEVATRQRALDKTRELADAGRATADEVIDAQRDLVQAQLGQLESVQAVIAALEEEERTLGDVFDALPIEQLATLETSIRAQRDELIASIEATQAAGGAYTEYADDLSEAMRANERLQAISAERVRQIGREAEAADQARTAEARLIDVRRRAAEEQLAAATTEADRTTAVRALVSVSNEVINQQQAELASLRELASAYANEGDLTLATQTRDQLVQAGDRMVNSLERELAATRDLATGYRERVTAIAGIRAEVDRLVGSVRGLDDPTTSVGTVRAETQRLQQMQAQNATLEEQRDQFRRISEAAQTLEEDGGRLSYFDQEALRAAEAAFRQRALLEEAAARESEQVSERQAVALEQQLGAAVESLAADTAVLTTALAGLLDPEENALEGVFRGAAAEAANLPTVIAAVRSELAEARAEAEALATSLGLTVDVPAFQANAGGAIDAIISTFENATDLDGVGAKAGRTFADGMQDALEELRDELAAELGPAYDLITSSAVTAGGTAGRGLADAFGNGLRQNENLILSAVDAVLQKVRERLPSSDAKRGPLSDLTASGRTFFPTWMAGVKAGQARVAQQMDRLLASARPSAGFTLAGAAMGAGTSAAAPVTLNVDGRPQSVTPGPLALSARQLAEQGLREASIILRARGGRR